MVNTVEKMNEESGFINGFTVKDESGKILGYVTFFFAYYTWVGKSLYMDDLYVRPGFRGKGLGSMLIREVISFARAKVTAMPCQIRYMSTSKRFLRTSTNKNHFRSYRGMKEICIFYYKKIYIG